MAADKNRPCFATCDAVTGWWNHHFPSLTNAMKLPQLSRPFLLALALPVALFATACKSGGGSSSTGTFKVGVDLNGTWTVTTRVTSVSGSSTDVVGETDTSSIAITAGGTASGTTLTIDAGTPDEIVGTLNGLRWTATRNDADGQLQIAISFNDLGTSFSGSGTFREIVSGTVTGTTVISITGTKSSVSSGGSLNVTLAWSSDADLDLEIVEPSGAVCDAGNVAGSPSAGGGVHSGDANSSCTATTPASQESVTYGSRPAGTYRVQSTFFLTCSQSNLGFFTVTSAGSGLDGTTSTSGSVTDSLANEIQFTAN